MGAAAFMVARALAAVGFVAVVVATVAAQAPVLVVVFMVGRGFMVVGLGPVGVAGLVGVAPAGAAQVGAVAHAGVVVGVAAGAAPIMAGVGVTLVGGGAMAQVVGAGVGAPRLCLALPLA